jgi:ubiquitin C-terminal hydrolase
MDIYQDTMALNNVPSECDEKTQTDGYKIIVRGLSGLQNIGNTCYMNSVLQCINHLPIFSAYMRKKKYTDRIYNNKRNFIIDMQKKNKCFTNNISNDHINLLINNTVISRLSDLLHAMWKENYKVIPRSFKDIIGIKCPMFRGYDQNDSHELLNFILDQVHEDIKADVNIEFVDVPEGVNILFAEKKEYDAIVSDENISDDIKIAARQKYLNYIESHPIDNVILESYIYWNRYIKNNKHSLITDLFTGIFYSKITCTVCGRSSNSFEPFTMLSIQTNKNNDTLDQCLSAFSEEEELTGINKYLCSVCNKKQNATKQMYIWEPPEYLIIHFKRFRKEYVNGGVSVSKINTLIEFPINGLTLDKCYSEIHFRSDYVYDLYAISEHSGGCNGGHYIAHCKNSINHKWYEFNDSSVRHVPDDKIEQNIITANAYILFYCRR